jgi:hypothetical protein
VYKLLFYSREELVQPPTENYEEAISPACIVDFMIRETTQTNHEVLIRRSRYISSKFLSISQYAVDAEVPPFCFELRRIAFFSATFVKHLVDHAHPRVARLQLYLKENEE